MTAPPLTPDEFDRSDPLVAGRFAELAPVTPKFELPRGPMGLWGALATVSVPSIVARELPLVDAARFGSNGTPFDYDPLLAVDLDTALDVGIDALPGADPVAG